jgi:site-specific DNA-methyltransferase (adenine-specific)
VNSEKPFTILTGDCLEVMRTMPAESVDSIVTDPPYELEFMSKDWDASGIASNVEMWREALRVIKPGGHLLAFSAARTYHRMVCAIEDAGWEIRDQIMWLYGSGFPKSFDVAKAIDKAAGIKREDKFEGAFDRRCGPTENKKCDTCGKWLISSAPCRCPRPQDIAQSRTARRWQGWGTALKPAHEPICVARKPLRATVAANVLLYGTGALNIDASRIPLNGDYKCRANGRPSQTGLDDHYDPAKANRPDTVGRWPANVVHDGSDEVLEAFDRFGQRGAAAPVHRRSGDKFRNTYGRFVGNEDEAGSTFHGDAGSAARFFYSAKASRQDRNAGCENMQRKPLHWSSGAANPGSFQSEGTDKTSQNNHPTVKPTVLLRYLVKLVTPPGGTVLDHFMGSGSTGKACMLEGLNFIGIEKDCDKNGQPLGYIEIARNRIAHAFDEFQKHNQQADLFSTDTEGAQ